MTYQYKSNSSKRIKEIQIKKWIEYKKENDAKIAELEERLQWFMKHSDIRLLKPATGYLRAKQLNLLAFANDFFEEINELEIQPFLIGGNLIGAYRHGGYVPWDDDLDFGLMRSDYDKLIEFCKEHYFVTVYDGKWSEYSNEKHIERMDIAVREHPGEYVLDIWVDQIQITKGTSCIDRLAIDFWAYDYYSDDLSIEDYVSWIRQLGQRKHEIDYVNKIIEYLNLEKKSNPKISQIPSGKIGPGIDNVGGYIRAKRLSDWVYTRDVLPFQKVKFESSEFWAPNNIEKWLEYEYPDYKEYPSDAGKTPHEWYKEKYILENMPCVEFYLVDAFEIYHFLPFYHYFEKNGIFAYFIAEKPKSQNAWFDYDEAIKILEANGVRYKQTPNYDANCVFTTQDAYLIEHYKGKKIHLCYGVGLTTYSFCESNRTIDGFDLKLVHGDCSYDEVKKRCKTLPMIKIGYPRYSVYRERKEIYDIEDRKGQILKLNTDNKPILLYFPTWDTSSSIDLYSEEIKNLRKNFFIITKSHHCTYRLKSEKKHRDILNEISDFVLEGNFSFEEATQLSDLVICDAVSGSATEVPYLNKNVKLLLLFSPENEKNKYKSLIDRYAMHIDTPSELESAVLNLWQTDIYREERNKIMDNLYDRHSEMGMNQLKEYIIKTKKRGE